MICGKIFSSRRALKTASKPKQKFGNFRNFVVRVSYFKFSKVDRQLSGRKRIAEIRLQFAGPVLSTLVQNADSEN